MKVALHTGFFFSVFEAYDIVFKRIPHRHHIDVTGVISMEKNMNKEFHQWYSPAMSKEMPLHVYGHAGRPLLVFPAMCGNFTEFEGFGMIDAIHEYIDSGRLMVFTIDSADSESWCNQGVGPWDRARRHNDYDAYVIQEVVPFINSRSGRGDIIATGCSMGGYQSMNFFLRHPDAVNAVIALSGLYHLTEFVGDYMDENVYFNSPLDYLPNCNDPWYIDRYRQSAIIACTGRGAWEDAMIADTGALKAIFDAKGIPAWCDFWGEDVNHDWPWWRVQLPYFLSHIL